MAEIHLNSRRYYPATKKDHGRAFVKHNYQEDENEGIDTHTTSSRYVPVTNKSNAAHQSTSRNKDEIAVTNDDTKTKTVVENKNLYNEGLLRAKERGAVLPVLTPTESGEEKVEVVVPHRAKSRGQDLKLTRNKKAFE